MRGLPIIASLALPLVAVAAPATWTPLSVLRHTAETAVLQARPGASVHAHIDTNVHLAACGATPVATVQGNGSTPSVRLSCAGPHPWTLYVPVRVEQREAVLVLVRPVGAGETITAAMVKLQPRNVASLSRGYFTDTAVAVGSVAARALPAGALLSTADVRAAPVIHRGQTVTLEFHSSMLAVSASGLALGDGAPGQTIRVENSSSHRIVSGVVDGHGRVIVGSG